MLEMNKTALLPAQTGQGPDSSASFYYASVFSFFRRQLPVVALSVLVCILLGVVYVLNAPSSYTARATMLIDANKVNIFQQQSLIGDLPVDSANVESQVEILRSENIALAVIKKLALTKDPDFVGPGGGVIGHVLAGIFSAVGADAPRSEFELQRRAIDAFQRRLSVKRSGLTYVIEITFSAHDPQRAAQIANAVADAYIADQLDAKYRATQRASNWLQDRIQELRSQATAADKAVVDFKNTHNLVVGDGGRQLTDQQVGEINTQRVLAQKQTAEAKARLDRIQDIINSGIPDGTVSDTLNSQVINKLREQYLELKSREADWSARYGFNHLATVHLRNQMVEIRRAILDELKRIAETYKSNYEIAKQGEAAIEKSLASAMGQSQLSNEAQVQLRDLQSSSQSARTLYDNLLQRYMQSVQQQTFPITEARLITAASAPMKPSEPRPLLVLPLAAFFGLAVGIALGRLRDLTDQVFRSTDQIEQVLNTNCIALVPRLTVDEQAKAPKPARAPTRANGIVRTKDLFWQLVDAPFSRAVEALRGVKVAIDLHGARNTCKIIGLTSALPNEGKSTIAVSLAQVIAQGGARVLLIDADLRNPSLTRRLAPRAKTGLIEMIRGRAGSEALWVDETTGLSFAPAVIEGRFANTHEALAAEPTKQLFDRLRGHYDYIIVDLSPLAPVVDVKAATHLVDAFVFVIEWGTTKIEVVEQALSDVSGVYDNLLGVVLNKVNVGSLQRYGGYRGSYYYNKYYARYGYTD